MSASGRKAATGAAFVSSRLGYAFPERMIGIHLNMLAMRREPKMLADPTPEEKMLPRPAEPAG